MRACFFIFMFYVVTKHEQSEKEVDGVIEFCTGIYNLYFGGGEVSQTEETKIRDVMRSYQLWIYYI